MIGRALRTEIERYARDSRDTNPLYTWAARGALTPRHLAVYLTNVHFLITHTPIYLGRARDRARMKGDEPLAAHFDRKIGEEAGHDAWAAEDLRRVTRLSSGRPAPRDGVLPAMRGLVDYLAGLIDADPALYLAYILFAEHLVVLMGPEWLALLEERCGIPRASMTVIANHAELDKDHVEHALEEIDDLVGDPAKLPRMREALLASMGLFDAFCAQLTSEVADAPLRSVARADGAVSAA